MKLDLKNGLNGENRPDTGNLPKNGANGFCNGVLTFCNAIAFEHGGEPNGKYLIAPFGDHRKGDYIQRIDAATAVGLKKNLDILNAQSKTSYSNVCPVYYDHPDDEDLFVVPNAADKTPYGKVRSLEILADGIWANIDWLQGFSSLPKRLQFSARWNADEIAPHVARPVRLVSLGLTSNPNIKGTSFANNNKGKSMLKKILEILKFSSDESEKIAADGNEAEAAAAVQAKMEEMYKSLSALEDAKKILEADLAKANLARSEAEEKLKTTSAALANSQAAFAAERMARSSLLIGNAVKSGKITEAQRETALKILANAEDFDAQAKKIDDQKPQIKVDSQTSGIEKGEKEREKSRQDAQAEIAKLVSAKTDGGMEYNAAWNAVKSEKPDLYKTAYGEE